MTLSEFKSWFAGYTEEMEGTPSAKQWKRIKKRVGEIDGNVTTERIFIDRWWPRFNNYYPFSDRPYYATCSTGNQSRAASVSFANDGASSAYDANSAMLALGKADYAEESA